MPNVVTAALATEFAPHAWEAEAAELCIAPGSLPQRLPTPLGNGRDFVLTQPGTSRSTYTQEFGCIKLYVWND